LVGEQRLNAVRSGIPATLLSLAGWLACSNSGSVPPPGGGAVPLPGADTRNPVDAGNGGAPGSSSGSADAAADADDNPVLSPTFVYRDINHILSTGQSLSVGAAGTPPLSTTQPYQNLMFSTGVISAATGLTAFAPLIEGTSAAPNAGVETMSAGLVNLVTKIARETLLVGQPQGKTSHDILLSGHGVGGTPYSGLKKGTTAYANGIAQVNAAFDLAKASNKSYVVRAVTTVHGEADAIAGNEDYEENLVEWQSDYETDVKAITGQSEIVPLFQTQISSWTAYGTHVTNSDIPIEQLQASIDHLGKIILVGPKYHLPYAADGVHLTNEGYRHMGEDYAKAYRRTILEGKPWQPLRPISATRAGAVITVKFTVPAPPLAFDDQAVTDPGNRGFEFYQDGADIPDIASVDLVGPDTVTVTLASTPTGTNQQIQYAYTGATDAHGGPTTGPRGNLRDSDATPSRNGYALYNWCVHFSVPVPYSGP
jgi:hypothetical protein